MPSSPVGRAAGKADAMPAREDEELPEDCLLAGVSLEADEAAAQAGMRMR